MARRASPNAIFLARAQVAQRLVREGKLDGELALSYTLWPTTGILKREQRTPAETLRQRAYDNGRQ